MGIVQHLASYANAQRIIKSGARWEENANIHNAILKVMIAPKEGDA